MIMAYQDSIGQGKDSKAGSVAFPLFNKEAISCADMFSNSVYPSDAPAIVMATLCSVHACLFRDTCSAHGGALEVKDPVTQEIPSLITILVSIGRY